MSGSGSKILGNYRILSELGIGLLGTAYLAEETLMGYKAVLRETGIVIQAEEMEAQNVIEAFKSLSTLKHPYICGLRTVFIYAKRLYLVTEYVPDKPLATVLEEEGAMPEERALRISRQITDALMYAHREGIFHGRLKASKVTIGTNDTLTIRDFGIAGILGFDLYGSQTGEGVTKPETNRESSKKRMSGSELDIYASGLLLYQMLTAKKAFAYEPELYHLLLQDVPPPAFEIPVEDQLSPKAIELISIMSTVTQPLCKLMTAKEIMLRRQEQVADHDAYQSTNKHIELSPVELVRVEGGMYEMGDHFSDGEMDERPKHMVKLYPFYIAKYPLSQHEWLEVMGNNPSFHKGENLPVESISWLEAVAYCNKRSNMEGLVPCFSLDGNPQPRDWSKGTVYCRFNANGYRLPTEAEWEYAARGGKKTAGYRYVGSSNVMEVAWCKDNSNRKPQAVGQKKANELGIHDMSGNVWEWCWDWYDPKFYTPKPVLNPTGPDQGLTKVLRGGSFAYQPSFMRVCCRHHFGYAIRYDGNGMRLVRSYLQSSKMSENASTEK